jgi:hypothetical protein
MTPKTSFTYGIFERLGVRASKSPLVRDCFVPIPKGEDFKQKSDSLLQLAQKSSQKLLSVSPNFTPIRQLPYLSTICETLALYNAILAFNSGNQSKATDSDLTLGNAYRRRFQILGDAICLGKKFKIKDAKAKFWEMWDGKALAKALEREGKIKIIKEFPDNNAEEIIKSLFKAPGRFLTTQILFGYHTSAILPNPNPTKNEFAYFVDSNSIFRKNNFQSISIDQFLDIITKPRFCLFGDNAASLVCQINNISEGHNSDSTNDASEI